MLIIVRRLFGDLIAHSPTRSNLKWTFDPKKSSYTTVKKKHLENSIKRSNYIIEYNTLINVFQKRTANLPEYLKLLVRNNCIELSRIFIYARHGLQN